MRETAGGAGKKGNDRGRGGNGLREYEREKP